MSRKPLSRRTLLKGAAGVGVSLPLLEAMLPRTARAQEALTAKRYLVAFGGSSLGHGQDFYVPATAGRPLELTTGLRPLAGRTADPAYAWDSLAADFSMVSGLKIGWQGEPGSRPAVFH